MLQPKKTKYRKGFKGRNKGVASRGTLVSFGMFGIKAQTRTLMNGREIEAARRVITRHLKRTGKLWIRVFPDKPITRKGAEVPMGSGKGSLDHYVAVVKPGRVLFELDGVPEQVAKDAFKLASHKLSCLTKFVTRI